MNQAIPFGSILKDMPVLGPGEFPPPKILDAGTYKVTVSKARLLVKEDSTTILIAMEELDSDEDGLGQLINKMGTVSTYVYEPKNGKPPSNRVHRFLRESATTAVAPKAAQTNAKELDDSEVLSSTTETNDSPSWLEDSA